MKNIKNILGMGAFIAPTSLAVSSCTEKSDWDMTLPIVVLSELRKRNQYRNRQ